MIILGIILAVIGWLASISILLWIGVALIIVGLVLNFVPIGGSTRRWY
jgi:drug/metabolite transporter (DMT)-like permease